MSNIETLKLEIAQHQAQLALKKAELKQKQDIEEANKPMRDSKLGRMWLKSVQGVTGWFANVNRQAEMLLESPEQLRAEDLLHKSDSLLRICSEIENREHKKAGSYAVKCAELVMLMEDMLDKHDLILRSELEGACVKLDEQVQRLRPVKDEVKKKQLESLVEQLDEGLQKLAQEA